MKALTNVKDFLKEIDLLENDKLKSVLLVCEKEDGKDDILSAIATTEGLDGISTIIVGLTECIKNIDDKALRMGIIKTLKHALNDLNEQLNNELKIKEE